MTHTIPHDGPAETPALPVAPPAVAEPRSAAEEAARWRQGRRDAVASALSPPLEFPVPGLLVFDPAGHVMSVNAAFRAIFACPLAAGMRDDAVAALLAAQAAQPQALLDLLSAATEPSGPTRHGEVSLLDGRQINVRIEPMLAPGGAPAGWTWCFRDVGSLRARDLNARFTTLVLQATFQNTPDGLLIVDNQGEIIAHNASYLTFAGLPPDSQPGGNHLALLEKTRRMVKNQDDFIARIRDLYDNPEMSGHEVIEMTNGTVVDRHSAPLFAEGHDYLGRVWFFHDITRERRDAEALRANATLLGNALKLANAAHWEYDIATDQFILDDDIYRMYGLDGMPPGGERVSPEGFITNFVHPSHRQMVRDEVANIPKHATPGLVRELELHGLFVDGSDGWFAVRYTVEGDADGVIRRALGVSQDITLKYRMQHELRASGEFYRVLIEQSLCAICIVDARGRLTYANALLEQLMRAAPGALIGRRAFSFVLPHDRAGIMHQAASYLAGRVPETRFEARLRTGDKRIIDILASTSRFMHGGRPAHLVFFMDISEQRDTRRQLEHLNKTLAMVSAGNELLIRAGSEAALLHDMCRIVVEVGDRVTAWIGYKDLGPDKAIKPVAHFGAGKDYVAAINATWEDVERGRGPTGLAIRTGITQINRDFSTNPALRPWHAAAKAYGFQASVAMPLRDESGVFGVFTIYSRHTESFLPDEMALLERLAEDLSYGISTRRIQAAHEQDARRQEDTLIATIEALGAMIYQRDPYTAGHQRSVAKLASAIATAMGMSEDHVRGIHLGALVHDIGKIKIPAEILTNPGKLSDLEHLIIRTHPQVGFDIVKGVDFPWPIAQMILQHHERLDGTGYPNGLKGDEILIESRILAVADVVDAMAARRPYREALGIEAALAEVERRKGSAFDPQVVDVCLRLFRQEGFTLQ